MSASILKRANHDFNKVRKYILRMTSDSHLEECENWEKFKSMNFKQFLIECGMLKTADAEDGMDRRPGSWCEVPGMC